MNITLRQIRYFQALAQEHHFGHAAARISVTQPALSAQIRALEEALGGALVDRARPGLPLTPLGREVLRATQAVLSGVRELEAAARSAAGLGAPLVIGMIPTVAPYVLPQLMPLIRREGAELRLREAVTATLMAELAEGRLDAALVALPVAGRDLVFEPVFEDRFLLARPLADAAPPPARPEEVDAERLLLLDEEHCLSGQALSACGLPREVGQRRFGAASLVTLARLVASGQGVTLLPEMAASVEGQGIRLSRFAAPEPGRTLALVRIGQGEAPAWFARLAALVREAAGMIPRPDVPMFGAGAREGAPLGRTA